MIPSGLTREHILAALGRIERQGIPPGRSSRSCELRYSGQSYPPKLVISLACEIAFGAALLPSVFTGGNETNGALRRLGFEIATRHSGVPPHVRTRRSSEPSRLLTL